MNPDPGPEPFEPTSDPDTYLPRPATEEALSALASYLRVGANHVVLTGPPGIGKSLLLRVLATRLEPHWQTVLVPYPALPPEEIAGWIVGLMGETPGNDPERTLIQHARSLRDTRSGLALLIDDAASMPLPSVRRLSRLSSEARPALPLVLALPDDERCVEIAEAIGPAVELVVLNEAMSEEETRTYLEARLLRAEVPEEERERFLEASAEAIHREAAGRPHSVNSAAAAAWRRFRVQADRDPGGDLAGEEREWRLGSALLGPSGPEVVDPWLDDGPPRETIPPEAPPEIPEPPNDEGTVSAAQTDLTVAPELDLELEEDLSADLELETGLEPVVTERIVWLPPSAAARAGLSAVLGLLLLLSFSLGRWSVAPAPARLPEVSAGVPEPIADAPRVDETEPSLALSREPTTIPETGPEPISTAPLLGSEVERTPFDAAALAEESVSEAGEGGEAEDEDAVVQVSINAVPWAHIAIDGEEIGVTPLADLPLERGTYVFRATFPDGRTVERVETVTTLNRRVLFR